MEDGKSMRSEKCKARRGRAVRTVTAGLLLAMIISGCSETAEQTGGGAEEVSIPMILIVDSSTGIRNDEKLIHTFNQM